MIEQAYQGSEAFDRNCDLLKHDPLIHRYEEEVRATQGVAGAINNALLNCDTLFHTIYTDNQGIKWGFNRLGISFEMYILNEEKGDYDAQIILNFLFPEGDLEEVKDIDRIRMREDGITSTMVPEYYVKTNLFKGDKIIPEGSRNLILLFVNALNEFNESKNK